MDMEGRLISLISGQMKCDSFIEDFATDMKIGSLSPSEGILRYVIQLIKLGLQKNNQFTQIGLNVLSVLLKDSSVSLHLGSSLESLVHTLDQCAQKKTDTHLLACIEGLLLVVSHGASFSDFQNRTEKLVLTFIKNIPQDNMDLKLRVIRVIGNSLMCGYQIFRTSCMPLIEFLESVLLNPTAFLPKEAVEIGSLSLCKLLWVEYQSLCNNLSHAQSNLHESANAEIKHSHATKLFQQLLSDTQTLLSSVIDYERGIMERDELLCAQVPPPFCMNKIERQVNLMKTLVEFSPISPVLLTGACNVPLRPNHKGGDAVIIIPLVKLLQIQQSTLQHVQRKVTHTMSLYNKHTSIPLNASSLSAPSKRLFEPYGQENGDWKTLLESIIHMNVTAMKHASGSSVVMYADVISNLCSQWMSPLGAIGASTVFAMHYIDLAALWINEVRKINPSFLFCKTVSAVKTNPVLMSARGGNGSQGGNVWYGLICWSVECTKSLMTAPIVLGKVFDVVREGGRGVLLSEKHWNMVKTKMEKRAESGEEAEVKMKGKGRKQENALWSVPGRSGREKEKAEKQKNKTTGMGEAEKKEMSGVVEECLKILESVVAAVGREMTDALRAMVDEVLMRLVWCYVRGLCGEIGKDDVMGDAMRFCAFVCEWHFSAIASLLREIHRNVGGSVMTGALCGLMREMTFCADIPRELEREARNCVGELMHYQNEGGVWIGRAPLQMPKSIYPSKVYEEVLMQLWQQEQVVSPKLSYQEPVIVEQVEKVLAPLVNLVGASEIVVAASSAQVAEKTTAAEPAGMFAGFDLASIQVQTQVVSENAVQSVVEDIAMNQKVVEEISMDNDMLDHLVMESSDEEM